MSEAKPQDGSTAEVSRTLSYGEVGKMNQFKDLSRQFIELLHQHGNDLNRENHCGFAFDWLREAEMGMKKACMFACRAVEMPDERS